MFSFTGHQLISRLNSQKFDITKDTGIKARDRGDGPPTDQRISNITNLASCLFFKLKSQGSDSYHIQDSVYPT